MVRSVPPALLLAFLLGPEAVAGTRAQASLTPVDSIAGAHIPEGRPTSSLPEPGPRWERVAFPYVNFGSDEGVGYGVIGAAYLRGGTAAAGYRMAIEPTLFLTSGGRRDLTLFVDAPGILPPRWRADVFVGMERHLAVPYYGIGNDTPYHASVEEEGHPSYYRFGRDRRSVRANLQRAFSETPFRILVGVGLARTVVDPSAREEGTTLLTQELGSSEARPPIYTRSLRFGVIRDTRDHEAVPRSGSWTEFLIEGSRVGTRGAQAFSRWTFADRRYLPITESLTFANRFLLQELYEAAPMHELMRIPGSRGEQEGLGGSATVRGLPANRYIGRALFVWNAELRWEAGEVEFLRLRFRPGAVAFLDSGRVWADGFHEDDLVGGLHHGAGAGLRVRLGENFLISADLGLSSGTSRGFYLGVGHLF